MKQSRCERERGRSLVDMLVKTSSWVGSSGHEASDDLVAAIEEQTKMRMAPLEEGIVELSCSGSPAGQIRWRNSCVAGHDDMTGPGKILGW